MTETTSDAGTAGSDNIAVIQAPASAGDNLSIRGAMRALQGAREEARKPKEQTQAEPSGAEKAAPETPTPESASQEADAAPQETEATGETQEADPTQVEPLLERPRSWSKERADAWAKLDRDTQQYLLDHDREASATVRKAQNEAAEKLKGLTVKEQAVDQARQQYEAALPQLLNNLQNQQAGEFADIKTMADVERLAREDWPRYLVWDVAQKKIAAVTQDVLAAQQRQGQEKLQQFTDFAKKEDDLFIEKVPDMADPDKAAKLQSAALTVLKDLGFDEADLSESWNGRKELSLRDHRVQLLIRDATLWREAQQKAKAATVKPVPPVQRPGVAQGRTASADAEIQNLSKQLETATGMRAHRLGAQLIAARRAAAARG